MIYADDGNLKIKNNTTISYLKQYPPQDIEHSLFHIVAQGLGTLENSLQNITNLFRMAKLKKAHPFKN